MTIRDKEGLEEKLIYHYDRLGSTDYLTHSKTGRIETNSEYDTWGAQSAKPSYMFGERQLDLATEYTGYAYDPVLSLYYAKHRMYDAVNRRFTAVDQIKGSVLDPQSMVQYTYVLNNPLRYIDPFGLSAVGLRDEAEKAGGVVGWDADTGTASITKDGETRYYSNDDYSINSEGRMQIDPGELSWLSGSGSSDSPSSSSRDSQVWQDTYDDIREWFDSLSDEQIYHFVETGYFDSIGIHIEIPSTWLDSTGSARHMDANGLRQELAGWVTD